MLSNLQLLEDKVIHLIEEIEKARAELSRLRDENMTLKSAQEQEKEKLSSILSLIEGA